MPIDLDLLAGRVSQQPQNRPQLDPDLMAQAKQDAQRWAEEDKRERSAIRDAYAYGMVSPLAGIRKDYQKRALREVKDPTLRQWLLEDVSQIAVMQEWQDRQERSKKGYFGRFAGDIGKVSGAFVGSGTGMVEAAKDIGKFAFGKERSPEDVKFMRALEQANASRGLNLAKMRGDESDDPSTSMIDTPGALGAVSRFTKKASEGAAGMAPDMAAGMAALVAGGPGASAAYWTARQAPESREDFIEMGVDPGKAAALGLGTAALTGILEQAIPDPTGLIKGKGFGRAAIRGLTKKARSATKAGLRKAIGNKTTAGIISRGIGAGTGAVARYAGELGEEGVQAAVEEAIKYNVAARDDDIENRDIRDIGRDAATAMIEAGPGLAVLGGAGGMANIGEGVGKFKQKAAGYKQSKMETEIIRFAQSKRTPSRKQWTRWGALAEEGYTQKNRKAGVNAIAGRLQQIARTRTVIEGHVPTEQQWKDWGFDPEEGLTPEARRENLFAKFKKGYQEEQGIRQSKQRAAEELRQRDDAISDQVSAAKAQEALQGPSDEQVGVDRPLLPSEAATVDTAADPGLSGAVQLAENLKGIQETVNSVIPEGEMPPAAAQQVEVEPPIEVETAAEAAQRAAEEARPDIKSEGFGLGGEGHKGERVREDALPSHLKAPTPEIEQRLRSAKGVKQESLLSRLGKTVVAAKNVATRAQEFLPNNAEFAVANEIYRLQKDVSSSTQDEAIRTVAAIVDPLGPQQLELFTRHLIVENQLAALSMKQPLRFGFESKEQVEQYRDKLSEAVENTPDVKKAIETRKAVVDETVDELVSMKLLPESVKENSQAYYHQQVLLHAQAGIKAKRSRVGTPGRKGFQKKRVKGESLSEEFDYNTEYVEAESSWLRDAKDAIKTKRLFGRLMQEYDIRDGLVKEAEAIGNDTTWHDLLKGKKGYVAYQARPGTVFHQATSITEKIIEQIEADALDKYDLSRKDMNAVLSANDPGSVFVIPEALANQLDVDKKLVPHGLAMIADSAMSHWKAYTLLNPKRALAYNIRNITGDLDPVIAADPSLLKFTGKAINELQKYYGNSLSSSRDLRAARDHGVIGSGFAAKEVVDLKDLAVFRRFFQNSGKPKSLFRPIKGYFDVVKKHTEFRENVLRYAAFLSAKKQLKSGQVKHYGGSRKQVVDKIHESLGVDAAAAHLARNLLGDYGNMTVMGEWIRKRMMPFWSFQEINIKRTPRLILNSIQAGQEWKAAGIVGKTAASALLTSRIAWLYGALWVWNNLVIPEWTGRDDEEDLSPYDRANPHVLLGNNPDGSTRVFRNVGALGDFLEWFGINEAIAIAKKYKAGQVTTLDVVKEMAKSPFEKIAGSLRPDLIGIYSVATGQSLFPEPFSPRSIRRGEAVTGIFGLTDEYKQMRGMILGNGERARKHYWQRWGLGVSDPRQRAISKMYDLRNLYLKKKGIDNKATYPVSRYKEARDAAFREDYSAFKEWRQGFIKEHGIVIAYKKFASFGKRLDPVASRLSQKDEFEFEYNFLTNEQRGQLVVARQYAGEMSDLLLSWWFAAGREENSKKDSQ